jgi:hypothetical protein
MMEYTETYLIFYHREHRGEKNREREIREKLRERTRKILRRNVRLTHVTHGMCKVYNEFFKVHCP